VQGLSKFCWQLCHQGSGRQYELSDSDDSANGHLINQFDICKTILKIFAELRPKLGAPTAWGAIRLHHCTPLPELPKPHRLLWQKQLNDQLD
jgi:hypothetical protein